MNDCRWNSSTGEEIVLETGWDGPTFFLIGASKCGTTAVYHLLKEHPGIYLPPVKEPHFFTADARHVLATPTIKTLFKDPPVLRMKAYRDLYAEKTKGSVAGDCSTSYYSHGLAAERIQALCPRAKIIVILRHPGDRAFSAFSHLRKAGDELVEKFEEALELEQERLAKGYSGIWAYTELGFYSKYLKPYFDVFPREQILVLKHEDFVSDYKNLIRIIYRFVGADETYTNPSNIHINRGGRPKSSFLHKVLWEAPKGLRAVVKALLPQGARARLRHKILLFNHRQERLDPLTKDRLTGLFRQDILDLEKLTGMDFSPWLRLSGISK